MKVSREQAAKNRERILDEAARQFRVHGFDGIGLADLMKKVGLTHGGFYGHFASKDDLMAQACAHVVADGVADWDQRVADTAKDPLATIAKRYLSAAHRDHPGNGCLMASLGPEVARQGPAVRRAVTGYFTSLVETLSKIVSGSTQAARRKKALVTFSSMVGAVILARAVDDPDLSDEILQAVSSSIAAPKTA